MAIRIHIYAYAKTCIKALVVKVLPALFENTATYSVSFIAKVTVILISVDEAPSMADKKNVISAEKSSMAVHVIP